MLLLLFSFGLRKNKEKENTVLRGQDGAAARRNGVSGLHPGLSACCERGHTSIRLPLVVGCLDNGLSMLGFGSKDLSCHLSLVL